LQQGQGGSTGAAAGQFQLAQKLIGDWNKGGFRAVAGPIAFVWLTRRSRIVFG
jgi:hypothetical protein